MNKKQLRKAAREIVAAEKTGDINIIEAAAAKYSVSELFEIDIYIQEHEDELFEEE